MSTWYVSASMGADSAPGTLGQPFKTIQEAANAAQPGDTVLIRGGVYRETVVPPRSGTASQPITFEPYQNEQVVIDGADSLANWSQYQGSIYQAGVSWNLGDGSNQLFFDGQMMTEARWPNTSLDVSHPTFATTSWANAQVKTVGPSTATIGVPLNDPAGTWVGATIHIAPGPGWVVQTGTVIASSPGSLTYQYVPSTPAEVPSAGNEFYLSGLFKGLDSAGEWYLDNSGKIRFWAPQNASPAGHDIELKHRQYAFDLSSRSYIHVCGIEIFGCTINTDSNSTNNLIQGITAKYVSQASVNAQPFEAQYHPHTSGIILNGSYNVIQNSAIDYSSGDGVFLGGNNNTVEDCLIENVDYAGGDEAGVSTLGSNEQVVGNTIFNAARSGIVIRFSPFDQVLHNVVHDVGLQLTDLGGIYTWGTDGHGAEIAYNDVYNVHTGGFGAAGIYLDNWSANYVVDHNVVWNCDFALKLNPPSDQNVIYNNTFCGTQYSVASSGNQDMSGTLLANNIFTSQTQIGSGAQQSHNLYTPPDPRFVNPSAGNFQLQAGSPAIDAGAALPPYNIPTAGHAPDIGAYEYGLAPFTAGASVSPLSDSGDPLTIPSQPPPTSSGSGAGQQSGTTSSPGGSSSQSGSGSTGSSGDPKQKPPTSTPDPTPPTPPSTGQTGSGSGQSGSGSSGSGDGSQPSTPPVVGSPLPTNSGSGSAAVQTTVLLTSSENPSLQSDSFNLTAHVLAPSTPQGTIWFYDGMTLLGTLPLGPTASVSLASTGMSVGTHAITASFHPDAGSPLAASTSQPLGETVDASQPGQPDVTALVLSGKQKAGVIGQFGQAANARVAVRLTNSGSGVASGPVKIDLYLSADEGLDSGDVFIASLTRNLRLRPSQTRTVSVPVRHYPSDAPSGATAQPNTYYILAQVSGLQSPTRLLASAATVKVQAASPELTVAFAAAVPEMLTPRRASRIFIDLENTGSQRLHGGLPIVLSLAPASSPGSAGVMLATIKRPINLASGHSMPVPIRYALPATVTPGQYVLVAQADPLGHIVQPGSLTTVAVSSSFTVNS